MQMSIMEYLWSGKWPSNRAPRVAGLAIDGKAAGENVTMKPGSEHVAVLKAEDPEGDALRFEWQILAEVAPAGYAGRGELPSQPIAGLVGTAEAGRVVFNAPMKDGAYRLFVFVRDGKGNGATANIPFLVQR